MSRKAKTKQELLESIRTTHAQLEKKFSQLTPKQMIWPGSMDNWSVKDILAHLVDWEQRFIGWYKKAKLWKMCWISLRIRIEKFWHWLRI
jgi:hypothetical protein